MAGENGKRHNSGGLKRRNALGHMHAWLVRVHGVCTRVRPAPGGLPVTIVSGHGTFSIGHPIASEKAAAESKGGLYDAGAWKQRWCLMSSRASSSEQLR